MDFSGQDLRGRDFRKRALIGANFSYAKLQGANFKESNLTNANFSYADLRGANFSYATLRKANFANALAGKQKVTIFVERALKILHLSVFGFITGLSVFISRKYIVPYFFDHELIETLDAISLSIITVICLITFISSIFLIGIERLFFIKYILFNTAITSFVCAITTSLLLNELAHSTENFKNFFEAFIFFLGFNSLILLIISFIYRGEKKNEKTISIVKSVFLSMYPTLETSFKGADLTSAIFSYSLGSADFREAKLNKIYWKGAKLIHHSRFGQNPLQYYRVAKLLRTLDGENVDLCGIDLTGINFQQANLKNANFIYSNLNSAILSGSSLIGAKLKQTRLDGADLTGATLTGAYLEDWGITAETKLDGIKCEYVYMRVPTKDDPNPMRKPDNRNEIFQPGDFADFIKPLADTLDLYHNQGVDPRAIAIAFKDLAESNPEAGLRIVAMEVKGEGKFLLRAQTAKAADKSELSAEYFSTYNQIKALSEVEVKALLGEKDRRIQSLEAMVVTALQRPSFYSHVERADMVSNNPGGISQSVSGGTVYGGLQAAQGSNNTQSQEIHSIASSEQGLTQDQVIQLFAQLESLVRQPEFPTEAQAKAAKYLDAAKEEVQAKEPDKQLAAGNLKRMAETIETTSKTMESGKKIWETTKPVLEALLPWLGVAKSFFGF